MKQKNWMKNNKQLIKKQRIKKQIKIKKKTMIMNYFKRNIEKWGKDQKKNLITAKL